GSKPLGAGAWRQYSTTLKRQPDSRSGRRRLPTPVSSPGRGLARAFSSYVSYLTQFSARILSLTVISGGPQANDSAAKDRLRCPSGRVVMRRHRGFRSEGVAR